MWEAGYVHRSGILRESAALLFSCACQLSRCIAGDRHVCRTHITMSRIIIGHAWLHTWLLTLALIYWYRRPNVLGRRLLVSDISRITRPRYRQLSRVPILLPTLPAALVPDAWETCTRACLVHWLEGSGKLAQRNVSGLRVGASHTAIISSLTGRTPIPVDALKLRVVGSIVSGSP